MQARFIGDPNHDGEGPNVIQVFGVTIGREWTPVPASAVAKLQGNSHFEVDADEDDEPGPSLDEVKAELDALGVEYHARSGLKKLLPLLEEARAAHKQEGGGE